MAVGGIVGDVALNFEKVDQIPGQIPVILNDQQATCHLLPNS